MPKIVVSAETDSRVTAPPDPADGNFAHESTEGRVTNVIAFVDRANGHYYGESKAKELDVPLGGTVYAVVADYASGDTFGTSGGHAQVLDFFTTEEEAASLLEAANGGTARDFGFTHNGVDYHRAWRGYFETLQSLDVWAVDVRHNPADPFRPKGTGRYSLKRGH